MGIINTTPDSFSDGGQFVNYETAIKYGLLLAEQGADILDIGGESSRPGAAEVSIQEELDRVIPVIEGLQEKTETPISIDTTKPEVMTAAVKAGASLVNDINGLRASGAIEAVANANVPVCIMHMLGQPKTMQQSPQYHNVTDEVISFLDERIKECTANGISKNNIIIDPGIGFGKSLDHNLTLLSALPEIKSKLQCELLIGVSRKSMIDGLLGRPVEERLSASLGLVVQARLNGAKILRVHDVRATFDAIKSVEAVLDKQTN